MLTEANFNHAWLWASTATFAVKGLVFLILAFSIHHEHAKVGSRPTPLGIALLRFFVFLFFASAALSVVFALALWAFLEGRGGPPPPPSVIPFWVRTAARSMVLAFPVGATISGVLVVRWLREEARVRANGGDTAYRQMRATERIADQGDRRPRP